jgi:hypothetical protein
MMSSQPVAVPEVPAESGLDALFKRFESLGNDCEFGLVQRIYKAENLGLLRWAQTPLSGLIQALDARFEEFGSAQHTALRVEGNEYLIGDERFGMALHTFTSPATVPMEDFAAEQYRRLQWLRRKLLEDLSAAKKIFVFKSPQALEADVLALYRALQRYAPGIALLFVRLQDATHPAGSVHRIQDTLFVGYLDRFSTVDISVRHWVQLCTQVAADLDSRTATERRVQPS